MLRSALRVHGSVGLKTMPIAPEDEGLHPADDDPDWQESAYLAWRDPVAGLGGNHRIGNEVNRGTANAWCGVYRDDGTRFRDNAENLALERLDAPGMVAGHQRLGHDGSALRFVLDADGCRVDLELRDEAGTTTATGEAFVGSKGRTGAIFSNNFHTACRVVGVVYLDDRKVEVDARGWRDHSWGVRRWDSFLVSRSFGGSLGPLAFRYGSMVGANGSFFRHGVLERDGAPLEVASADMRVALDDDSVSCRSAEVRYHLASGATTRVRIEITGGMLGVTGQRYGWESVGDVWVDDEPGGWGFLEVNNNPRNGREPPVFVLDGALANGLTRPER